MIPAENLYSFTHAAYLGAKAVERNAP